MTAKKETTPKNLEAEKTATAKKQTTPKGFVSVKILQGTIHGHKVGDVIELDENLVKAYGPDYVKVVKKGEKEEDSSEDGNESEE